MHTAGGAVSVLRAIVLALAGGVGLVVLAARVPGADPARANDPAGTLVVLLIAGVMTVASASASLLLSSSRWRAGPAAGLRHDAASLMASPAYLLGPTGGYLIGWVGAAFLVGSLAERGYGRTLPRLMGVIFLGSIVTFVCGVSWLAFIASVPPAGQSLGLDAGHPGRLCALHPRRHRQGDSRGSDRARLLDFDRAAALNSPSGKGTHRELRLRQLAT